MDAVLRVDRLALQVGRRGKESTGEVADEHHPWLRRCGPIECAVDGSEPAQEWACAVRWGLGHFDGRSREWPASAEVLHRSRGHGGRREGHHRATRQARGRWCRQPGDLIIAQWIREADHRHRRGVHRNQAPSRSRRRRVVMIQPQRHSPILGHDVTTTGRGVIRSDHPPAPVT